MTVPRPTRAEIDLAALRDNFLDIRRVVGDDCAVLAVVKADAYGHGVARVAPALAAAGAEQFGVALVEEGIEVRGCGIERPVLVLGGSFAGQEQALIEHELTPALSDLDGARRLDAVAGAAGRGVAYHLKVDTGMGRLGVPLAELGALLTELKRLRHLEMRGLMSHLALADEPRRTETGRQCRLFEGVVRQVEAAGFAPRFRHLANSAGIYSRSLPFCNMVRPGIALYGGLSGGPYAHAPRQRPVMRLVSQVALVKRLLPGQGVSYGHRFIAERPTTIAAVPIGYADGYNRLLSNRGEALLRGRRVRVVGTVCMDWTLLDVSHLDAVAVGDEVTLLGCAGDDCLDAGAWADKVGSITYEVFCNISKRVPRVFNGG
jgi:alanine racemase